MARFSARLSGLLQPTPAESEKRIATKNTKRHEKKRGRFRHPVLPSILLFCVFLCFLWPLTFSRKPSCQDALDHVRFADAGQLLLQAVLLEEELILMDSEQVQDRGMPVGDP